MKSIYDIEVIKSFISLCEDGNSKNWHERNGGNLTYRLSDSDVDKLRVYFSTHQNDWIPIRVKADNLTNEFFIVTGSGKYFKNIKLAPQYNFGIVEINDRGDAYRIVWGLENGGVPTSEFESHLLNHNAKKNVSDEYRVIYHAHCPNIIAMTFIVPLKAKDFSNILWKMATECPVVFPSGVGVVDWMVPGGPEIALESSKLMALYDAIVWAHHGLFCAGKTLDETFGLMDTIEKAADIFLKIKSSGLQMINSITDDDIRAIGKAFKVQINEDFLD
ncbi:MAG: rhamnulose-1-phosphate aldolase [Sphaerochaetaceae bacterium]|nr:rhamnulose-1-phosphate aldolase [Sphaerochaetaceae bacterium]